MHGASCGEEGGERHGPDDDAEQDHQGDLLHGPEGWRIGGVEQVLRGKIPGHPG